MKELFRQWLFNVLVAFDRFMNVVLMGKHGQTISSRAAIARKNKRYWGCLLCWLLEKLDENHCQEALETDKRDADEIEKEQP